MVRMRVATLLAALLVCTGTAQRGGTPAPRAQAPSGFAAEIARLSEPDGYFDTDNLISNEGSYLQVLPELRRGNVRGGAYIGVGPDQNFSYIADVRPAIAFMLDVRRDNLLLHLLFKALFQLSRTRVEYLALLTGRPVPGDVDTWSQASIERLVSYIDGASVQGQTVDAVRRRADDRIKRTGVTLSNRDFETIDRFHRRFIEAGLDLQFQSTGRPPQSSYPTYRQLLVDTDPLGKHGNYLASEEAFQFVKSMEMRDLVIPVVGNLSGPSALVNVGKAIAARGEKLTAFYVSNVEFYLFRDGTFPRFVANLGRIPRTERSVVIRSVFGRYGQPWPRAGDASTSSVQLVDDLVKRFSVGRLLRYDDLISR